MLLPGSRRFRRHERVVFGFALALSVRPHNHIIMIYAAFVKIDIGFLKFTGIIFLAFFRKLPILLI